MADISNKSLGLIISAALVVSLIGLFTLPNGIFSIFGRATTDTGYARINITGTAAINVTNNVIDFGNGTMEAFFAGANCTLTSQNSSTGTDPFNCWTGSGAERGLEVTNVGNLALNVTATGTRNGSLFSGPLSFWGTGNSTYLWKCAGNGTSAINSNYTPVQNESIRCSDRLSPSFGQDQFVLHINITFPDYVSGLKNDTITFTASVA